MNATTKTKTTPAACSARRPSTNSVFTSSLFDELFDGFFTRPSGEWMPAADVTEANDHVDIRLDVPGVVKENIEITVENGQLVISGNRDSETVDESATSLRRERRSGSFSRRFAIGDRFDADGIRAEIADGVLTVHVPKAAAAVARRVEIG